MSKARKIGLIIVSCAFMSGQLFVSLADAEGFPFAISRELLAKSSQITGISENALSTLKGFLETGIEQMTIVEESGFITKIESVGDLVIVSSKEFALDTSDPGSTSVYLAEDRIEQMISLAAVSKEWGVLFVKENGALIDAGVPCIEASGTEDLRKAFEAYQITGVNMRSADRWYEENRIRLIKSIMNARNTGKLYLTREDVEQWYTDESEKVITAIMESSVDIGFLEFKKGAFVLTPPPDRT